jgi:protein SCO1/2
MNGLCARAARGLVGVALLLFAGSAGADTALRAPADLRDRVGFDQELGAQLPLATALRDVNGANVRLRDVLNGRPALLVPGYFGCVNLCSAVRAGVAHAIERSGLKAGRDFEVLLLSLDPHELPAQANTTQRSDAARHPGADIMSWHYLTGAQAASAAIMRGIGFRYFFDARNGQYDHDVGIVLLSGQGRVTQYLFGTAIEPQTLRLALVNASQGRIGNLVDHFLLLCCDYDPATGRYGVVIRRVLQGLGLATVLTLAGLIYILRRSEAQRTEAGCHEHL